MNVSIPLLDIFFIAGRMAGMIFTAPIFGSRNYPIPAKIGIVFFLTVLIFPSINSTLTLDVSTYYDFAMILINELLIGIF